MTDNRYQYQPCYIKLWRRRWYLWYYTVATLRTVQWFLDGCPRNKWVSDNGMHYEYDTRWFSFKFIWIIAQSEASMKMEWYFTMEEVFVDLHEKIEDNNEANH